MSDKVPLSDKTKGEIESHFRRELAVLRRNDRDERQDRAAIGLSRMLLILAVAVVLVILMAVPFVDVPGTFR